MISLIINKLITYQKTLIALADVVVNVKWLKLALEAARRKKATVD